MIKKKNKNFLIKLIENDRTPYEGKLSCTVWNGGKSRDNIKALPIVIVQQFM